MGTVLYSNIFDILSNLMLIKFLYWRLFNPKSVRKVSNLCPKLNRLGNYARHQLCAHQSLDLFGVSTCWKLHVGSMV